MSNHIWWKWSEPTMTRTSGRVSRKRPILATHSSANGCRCAPVAVLVEAGGWSRYSGDVRETGSGGAVGTASGPNGRGGNGVRVGASKPRCAALSRERRRVPAGSGVDDGDEQLGVVGAAGMHDVLAGVDGAGVRLGEDPLRVDLQVVALDDELQRLPGPEHGA